MSTRKREKDKDILWKDLCRAYMLQRHREGKMPLSAGQKVVEVMEALGPNTKVDEKMAKVIGKWREERMDQVLPGTVARQLKTIYAILNWGYREDLVPQVKRVRSPMVKDERVFQLTPSMIRSLYNFSMINFPLVYPFFVVLLETGARWSEMTHLTWDKVGTDFVRVGDVPYKWTKCMPRLVPMTKMLRGWMEMIPEVERYGRVVKPVLDKDVWGRKDYRLAVYVFRRWQEAEGLTGLRIHDLRHTFAYRAAAAGADLADLMTIMGHSNPKTTMRYRGIVLPRLAELGKLI